MLSIQPRLWISLITCAVVNTCQPVFSQADQVNAYVPEVKVTISAVQYSQLKNTVGQRQTLRRPVVTISNDTAAVKEIHTRGQSSLQFSRKSFSIDLDKAVSIRFNGKKINLKKFDLISLAMDKNLWHNRWSFLMLSELSLFPLYNSFCTLTINGQPEGIYLLVEKPSRVTSRLSSPYMVRRGMNHTIDREYSGSSSKKETQKYRKQYKRLYSLLRDTHGQLLQKELASVINLDRYFLWLAFNYLILNGDYSDELFLYINPSSGLFEVMGWDYDDILRYEPHEGKDVRSKELSDRLIFSLEDELDKTIARDDELYSAYRETLTSLLIKCDTSTFNRVAQQVERELENLGSFPEQCQATLYLDQDSFDITKMKSDLHRAMGFLIRRRNAVLSRM